MVLRLEQLQKYDKRTYKMIKKGIIFDFDGVIAESVKIKSDAFENLFKKYGPEVMSSVVKHHEANGGMSRFEKIRLYHEKYLGEKIDEKRLLKLANDFSKLVIKKVIESPYVPGVFDFIKACYVKYDLFISTGTPTEEIKRILIGRKIEKYFLEVYGSPDNKITHLKEIMDKHNYDPGELTFYGDANSDLDAAKYFNVPFVLIKNQFNAKIVKIYDGKMIDNFKGLL
jgi:phosphoglycolate phosphatase-like HAD superfamily hydrolase